MKAWAKSFYLSAAWEQTRAAYLMSQDYICERCGQPAKIVHHKRWLNRENINDMALCGLPVKKVWEKVREFLAKYTDELPDTDELDGDSTTGNVEERRTQER